MTEPPQSPDPMDRLWSYADLAARWGVGGRSARRIAAELGLKPVTLGSRTVRFRPCSVAAAEERREQGPKRRGLLNL